jgi:nitrogen regulation protein NR(I)
MNAKPLQVWLVDDDASIRWVLEKALKSSGMGAKSFDQADSVLAALRSDTPDVLMTDIRMPGRTGLDLLKDIQTSRPGLPVIVMTAHSDLDAAVAAYQGGAFEYLPKPFDIDKAVDLVRRAAQQATVSTDVEAARRSIPELLGQAAAMQQVFRAVGRLSRSSMTVLITGESGTGKELVARALHRHSPRAGEAFVALNTAAFTADLLESELFGHEKGAFTGANEKHLGKFVEAHGGTLFLDEIGELPPEAQVKLLRALQEGEVDPVGSKRPVKVDLRLISATNQDLIEQVKRGAFREDLYYRLNVFPITVPPLRVRRDDILDLARRFAQRFAAEDGKRLRGISAEALALLESYDWPGNVRQLENALFRAVVLADGDELTVAEFPQIANHVKGFDVRIPALPQTSAREVKPEREIIRVEVRDPNVLPLLDAGGNMRKLDQLEAETIKFALDYYRGQMSAVARKLGIGRSTLYRKMKEYGFHHGFGDALGEKVLDDDQGDAAA